MVDFPMSGKTIVAMIHRCFVVMMIASLILLPAFSVSGDTGEKLSAPSFPHVKRVGNHALEISWNKVGNAAGYEIFRYNSAKKTYQKMKTIRDNATLKWKNGFLKNGRKYTYKIRAYQTISDKKEYSAFTYSISAVPYMKNAKTVNAGAKFKGDSSMDIGIGQKRKLETAVTPSLFGTAKKKSVVDKTVRIVLTEQTFAQMVDNTTIIGKQVGRTNVYALAHNGNVKKVPVNVVDYAKPAMWMNLDNIGTLARFIIDQEKDLTDVVSYLASRNDTLRGKLFLDGNNNLVNPNDMEIDEIIDSLMRLLENCPYQMEVEAYKGIIHITILFEHGRYCEIFYNIQNGLDESKMNDIYYPGIKIAEHWFISLFAPI